MFTKRLERMYRPSSDLNKYENEPYTRNPLLKFRLKDVYEQRHLMFLKQRASQWKMKSSHLEKLEPRKCDEYSLPQWHYVDNLRRSARKIVVPRMLNHIEKKILHYGSAMYGIRYPEIVKAYMVAVHEHFNQLMYTYSVQTLIRKPEFEGPHEETLSFLLERKNFRFKSSGRTANYANFLQKQRRLARQLLLTELPVRAVLSLSELELPATICDFKYSFSGHGQLSVQGIGGRNAGPYRAVHKHVRSDIEKLSTFLRWTWYPKVVATLKKMFRRKVMPMARWTRAFACIEGLINRQINNMKQETLLKLLAVVGDPRRIPMLCFSLECRECDQEIDLNPSFNTILDMYITMVHELMDVGKKLEPLPPQVNTSLIALGSTNLKVEMNEIFVNEFLVQLRQALNRTYEPTRTYVKNFRAKYSGLCSKQVSDDLDDFLRIPHNFDDYFAKIDEYFKYIKMLLSEPHYDYFEMAVINNDAAVNRLRQTADALVRRIVEHVEREHIRAMEIVCADFEVIKERALEVPKSTEELLESAEYMVLVKKEKIGELRERILYIMGVGNNLVELAEMEQYHLELTITTINWLHNINEICDYNASQQEQYKFVFEEHLQDVVKKLSADIVALVPKLSIIDEMSDPTKFRDSYILLQNIIDQLKVFDVYVHWVNKEEKLFKIPQTTYPTLEVLKDFVYPFAALIKLCIEWLRYYNVWLDGPFEYLEPSFVEETTGNFLKEFQQNQKYYRNKIKQDLIDQPVCKFRGQTEDPDPDKHPVPLRLCNKMITAIKDFTTGVFVVRIMCNPALRRRHWREMSEIAGFDMMPDAGTTLRKILNFGLDDKLDQFEIISVSANKEKQLQDNLHKMIKEWDERIFPTGLYKETGVTILSNLDDIQALLDDHLLKTLSMRGSAFMKPCEEEVLSWYEKIIRINKTLEEWSKVQSSFLYLLPIFSSEDILAQMPEEGVLFTSVEQTFANNMAMVLQQPLVIVTAPAPDLLESLQMCVRLLDQINTGVNNYLEKKRLYFPRFFFLSNDEMLEILSETKDPLRVQPHLNKCFEGIHRLQFDDNKNVRAMMSSDHEVIDFIKAVSTVAAGGGVEKWLAGVEEEMFRAVRCKTEASYTDYVKSERGEWVQKWPQMVVLCVSQIYWAAEVHAKLQKSVEVPTILAEFLSDLNVALQELVALVRSGGVSNLNRITIKSLIVVDVHAKDVVEELMHSEIKSEYDFQWLAQLRYYRNEDETTVSIINASVPYANEYLGNSDRLVLTPLTDRCYRTLIAAYQQNLNGAPEGPAGTGKTETTKDLAKALAIQCKVFNCSKGLDYKAMAKFFKGLASCGAWACFDEFNRIELEVLSVVAQQMLLIIQAVRSKATTFMLENSELKLNPLCFVCITMNPGYAGRFQLPDNLKILFRSVAMMVPDYAMIAEISLYSFGFVDARKLSVKIVTTYRLCSEQLSVQSHYDYGMRAVKSVLTACGDLKHKHSDHSEEVLLLRSLLNVNMPKFMSFDVPLFEGIISDIFPGVAVPEIDFTLIKREFMNLCQEMRLEPTEYFLSKVVQTYEMMIVRHGFMLVGDPLAGKSKTLEILSKILSTLKTNAPEESTYYQSVNMGIINPKSITINQLYGHFDVTSYEWSDGLVPKIFRNFATSSTPDRKWLVFDGPVDAIWIENLNTVLDDNRKLCLISGEVIKMSAEMSLIFEVVDLAQASPATVSRCGMIYMEPEALGWRSFANSWLKKCDPRWADEENIAYILLFLQWLIEPCQAFVQKHCNQYIQPGKYNCMMTTFDLFEIMLNEAVEENLEEYQKFLPIYFQAALLYSIVWGVAGVLDADSREKFDAFLKELWTSDDENVPNGIGRLELSMPTEGLLVDYVYIFKQRGSWKSWHELVKRMDIEVTSLGVQVPTIDTARYIHILEMHIRHRKQMLLVGPSGTGKSAYIQNFLMNKLDLELYETGFITFTVTITANQTQDLLISKLFKRKRGIYGPPKGKTGILFVDDMNMPVKELYGAQPPLELLRQYFDYGYVYDLKDSSKITIQDLIIVSACGLPGGSRQDVYSRFQKHFNIFSVNPFATDTVNRIFVNVLLHGFKRSGHGNDVAGITNQIVTATQEIYKSVQSKLRATPEKSHYIFNARDISRVVTGCALLRKESVSDRRLFVRVWYHEALRVFADRLISDQDRDWLMEQLNECVSVHFKEKVENVFENYITDEEDQRFTVEHANQIIFGVYFDEDSPPDDRRYEEVPNLETFLNIATRNLEDYNATRRSKIDITLFEYALQHLNRICRVISIPGASALLVGIAGSGRQSLTKLATNIVQTSFFQPEITKNYGPNDWHYDIKKVLKEAGGVNKHTVFLMTENQILTEMYLQDIDCLLNQGEVPNIYAIDEKQEILELVRLAAQGGNRNIDISPLQVFSFFVNRCKQKVHIVLCLSPIGDSLRTRVRLYPSLVNCCTIDWYQSWPEEALQMIAKISFEQVNLPEELKMPIIGMAQYFHTSADQLVRDFCAYTGRFIYHTNAAFLELIKSFQNVIALRQSEVMEAKMRYIGGLDTLANAAEAISKMQMELNSLQPKLAQFAENSRKMLVEINTETMAASAAAEQVKKDEVVAGIQAQAAQELKSECEKDLAQAIPVLEDAIQALNTLKPADITLVKSMKNPPPVIKLVMAAVCVIKGLPPDRIADPATGKMINDYWGPSKRILGDMNFLQSLKDFDKDNINPEIMKKIRKDFIPNKDFHPKIVAKASSAAEGLCKWIIAMDLYDNVAKIVAPKKAKLAAAEKEYADTMRILTEKREMAAALEEKVARLNDELERANAEMQRTQDESDYCQSKLLRAEALISSLGGEKSRWTTSAEGLQAVYNNLPGDTLLSCGIIAYLSAVNFTFRKDCVNDWFQKCLDAEIPCSADFSITKVLGVDVTIQTWNIGGLPKDTFSIENAIISKNSSRYSLFIDPQGQANTWIKSMERKNRFVTVKFNQKNYMKAVAEAVEYGYPLIVENILNELEAPLDPILARKTFIQNGKMCIALGDNVIPFNANFRLYMTCNLRNPHFLPETFNKVTIINFVLTQGALEDQLLNIVVAKERPDLQELRIALISEAAKNKAALVDAENMILQTLSTSEGDILENENAIVILNSSKELAQVIVQKQTKSAETEKKIEAFRLNYKTVASHSAVVYYSITDLPNIDPMYQFSLKWYIHLYQYSIDMANKSKDLPRRIKFLVEGITRNLYNNVCRSIFEKDKLLFSFILTCRILLAADQVNMKQISYLVSDAKLSENGDSSQPPAVWISKFMWANICRLEDFDELKGLADSVKSQSKEWQQIFDHFEPETQILPSPWHDKTTRFEKLLILKALRPDKLFLAVRRFIADEMGAAFITPPEFDLSKSYAESNALTPLIFILSEGADPLGALLTFAEKMGKDDTFQSISLGQSQGPIAQGIIKNAQELGNWVCLQNCHLAIPWMTTLEYLWENMDTFNTSTSFRLWLTAYPTSQFPVPLLQNGVKMTNEPPTGLKENIMRSYNSEPINETTFYTGCAKQDRAFTRLLFGICFFHAVVQERRKFGSLGWNISYGFNESDLQISVLQLNMLLDQYDHVPYEALSYLVAECNYGGRVTDDWDRRAIVTILGDFINPQVVSDMRYQFAADDRFILPRKSEHREVLRYVENNIPSLAQPEVFGLHENSGITRDLQTTATLLQSTISLMENELICFNGGSKYLEAELIQTINDILVAMPENVDIDAVRLKYPIDYNESMNTVLVQEMGRFLILQMEIKRTCYDLEMAINGSIVMTPALECIMNSFKANRIPNQWMAKSYPSQKLLGSYVEDLAKRIAWLNTWYLKGKPETFWLSGFFFTQAFLTGALQNFARKHQIPIDTLTFDYEVLNVESMNTPPNDGAYINGLFLEGARWNWEENHIDEQLPKVLIYNMPIIYLKPQRITEFVEGKRYKCPLYRTAERKGSLSTTGHSTNFVNSFFLETEKQPAHWIKRSAALICQTTD